VIPDAGAAAASATAASTAGGGSAPAAELRNIEDGGEAFGPGVLQRLLLSLRDGTPPEAVSKRAKPRPSPLPVERSDHSQGRRPLGSGQ